jgi:Rrf2 family protein
MKLSTKVRYGMRAMAELALADPAEAVSARRLAESQQLSVKYLEHIMAALKAASVVIAVRGKLGGYRLARASAEISLADIFQALGRSPSLVECVEEPESCPTADTCPTRETWVKLSAALAAILRNTTLSDLAHRSDGAKRPTRTAGSTSPSGRASERSTGEEV